MGDGVNGFRGLGIEPGVCGRYCALMAGGRLPVGRCGSTGGGEVPGRAAAIVLRFSDMAGKRKPARRAGIF